MRRLLRRPAVIAWLPVVVLPPLLVFDAAVLHEDAPPVSVAGVLAAIVGCLPLVVRSRYGFAVLAPAITAGIVLVLWLLEPGNLIVLIPMVALAELALRGERRRSLWVGLAVIPCVVISVAPFADDKADFVGIVLRSIAFCLLALAAGEVVRTRRRAVEELALRRVGDERLRIAREVHDVVAHAMVAINVQAGVAAHLLDRDPEQARTALRDIKTASGEALADLRATLGVLREGEGTAPVGPASGLHDLDELAAGLRAAGVRVELDVGDLAGVPAAVHAAGYRIVQEALTNALRHARPSVVRVRVRPEGDALGVEVVDDGAGGSAVVEGAGHGLRGMRERAAALDGTLECGPGPGGGWRVRASLPLPPAGVGALA